MNRAEILQAFIRLSAEDQEAVRAKLVKEYSGKEAFCCSPPMQKKLMRMMAQMEASEDPMAMCHEMMRLCSERMEEHTTCK